MGLLARWLGTDVAAALELPSPLRAEDVASADPVVAAAFGLTPSTCNVVTREEAMTIPAVRRGRAVIAGVIGGQPLVALRGAQLERVERPLLVQPDPNTTRQYTLTWTVDSLMFYGVAWWRVLEWDDTGYPTSAEWVAPWRITVDVKTGTVRIDGVVVENANRVLIRFDGPDEGLLAYGGRTLRTCLLLEEAVRRFANMDIPLGVLRLADGADELTADEITDLLDEWETSRRQRSIAYLNRSVEYDAQPFTADDAQLADSRQYQAGEVARLLNLPPRYVNAPAASGMTYTNVQAERLELVDLSLAPYLTAVEQRLSMGDVTPRGQVVKVDLTGFLRGDQKTAVETAAAAITAGMLTAPEARADVYNRPPIDGETAPTPGATA